MRTLGALLLSAALGVLTTASAVAQPAESDRTPVGWTTARLQATGEKQPSAGSDEDPWTPPALPKESPPAVEKMNVVVPNSYPTAEIDRPFAVPAWVLEPRANSFLDFRSGDEGPNQFAVQLGAGFGLLDDLEVGLAVPLSFTPKVRMGDMQLYGLYDLSSMLDELMLATRMRFVVPMSDGYSYWGADFALLVDAPAKYKIVDMLALVADAGLGLGFYPGKDAFLLYFDFGTLVQPMDALALELTFGVHVFAGREVTQLPLRLLGQYTMIGDLDLYVEMAFLDLNHLGADWFQVTAGAAFRLMI